MWEYLRFEPWQHGFMQGVVRTVTLEKSGLLGVIARYYALDYIVWQHRGSPDMEEIFSHWKPKTDVMTQRFLFVTDSQDFPLKRMKSFWIGFAGYLELYTYCPGGAYDARVKDMIPPVDYVLLEKKAEQG